MYHPHFSVPFAVIVAGIAGASSAHATVRVGYAMTVERNVSGTLSGQQRKVFKGDDVFENDFIRTETESSAGLRFVDKTQLMLGPRAIAKLDRLVINPDQSVSALTVNARQGAVRWISGESASEAYQIKTSTVTIRPHGTMFDALVEPRRTTIVLQEGIIEVCLISAPQRCRVLSRRGELITTTLNAIEAPQQGGPGSHQRADGTLTHRFSTLIPMTHLLPVAVVDPTPVVNPVPPGVIPPSVIPHPDSPPPPYGQSTPSPVPTYTDIRQPPAPTHTDTPPTGSCVDCAYGVIRQPGGPDGPTGPAGQGPRAGTVPPTSPPPPDSRPPLTGDRYPTYLKNGNVGSTEDGAAGQFTEDGAAGQKHGKVGGGASKVLPQPASAPAKVDRGAAAAPAAPAAAAAPAASATGSSSVRHVVGRVLRAPVTAALAVRARISSSAVNPSTARATSLSIPKVNASTPTVKVPTPSLNTPHVSAPHVTVNVPSIRVPTVRVPTIR